jgi:hypothetical protein
MKQAKYLLAVAFVTLAVPSIALGGGQDVGTDAVPTSSTRDVIAESDGCQVIKQGESYYVEDTKKKGETANIVQCVRGKLWLFQCYRDCAWPWPMGCSTSTLVLPSQRDC